MWAAQLRAPPPTQCALSSPETSVLRGTCWSRCVLVRHSLPPYAPRNSTLPASISLVQLRAGGGRLFTLANCGSVGKYWNIQSTEKQAEMCWKGFYILWYYYFSFHSFPSILTVQVNKVPLVSGLFLKRFCSSYLGVRQCLHWSSVPGHVQRSRSLCGRHPLCLRPGLLWSWLLGARHP